MEMNYTYNEMKLAFDTGRNFQLTGENNFKELIETLSAAKYHFCCVSSDSLVHGMPCKNWCGDANCKFVEPIKPTT
jgi:hypothetical protein